MAGLYGGKYSSSMCSIFPILFIPLSILYYLLEELSRVIGFLNTAIL